MTKIVILGAGVMGSAFSVPCNENSHETIIAGTYLDNDFIDQINQNDNFHPVLKIKLSNKTKYIKQNELSDQKYNSSDLIVIATNSKGLDWCPEQLKKICLENRLPPILLLTKGLNVYNNQYELLAEKLQRLLLQEGFDNINISVVGGPCLARDLANKIHSSVVVANKDLNIARWLQELLRTNYYHISITDDIIGVEVCAAIKNIFAMIIGSAKGLNLKENNNNQNETDNLNTAAELRLSVLF